ncbi:MAG: radical SAM protein [Clostridia bacterium]
MAHIQNAIGILSAKNGMNLYRGCTHGCIYCDSRSTCYQIKHDFEDVAIKRNAPELLEAALRRKRTRCMISTGAMCDPYLPLEAQEQLTRKCLALIDRYGFGVTLLTKSDLVLRDLDLLKSIHAKTKCVVQMTLTTYDENLCRILEPCVCTTARRLEVLKILRDEGIPTVVWLCPILPFLNDTEENLRGILNGCFEAGVHGILCFGMGVTLREGDREYFYRKLDEHFGGIKEKYIAAFGNSYECNSPHQHALMQIFDRECQAQHILYTPNAIFDYLNQFENKQAGEQLSFL